MGTQRISVRIPDKTARRLRERSRASGVRESAVVREALETYLSKTGDQKSAYDVALEAGLIGCARGAPRDLSANKKYFRGFGRSKR
jgi:predicted DNA-binding protein